MIKKFLDLGMQPLANKYLTKKEIFKKERRYIKNGGKFITHIPIPRIV